MSRENELPIFSCKCFIGHHGPVHIYRWGGGRSFGGNKWFSGGMEGLSGILIQPPTRIISRRFSMLVHLLIKFVNKLSNMIEVVEFITSNMQTIITQYLVTVDLFFSNICRGVFGIPCTRLRHNCVVN